MLISNNQKELQFLNAIQHNQIDQFYSLIDEVELDCEDERGLNALFLASSTNNLEILSLLLKKGINISLQTKWGENALFFAAENGNQKIIQFLLSNGLCDMLNQKDIKGNSILHYSAMGKFDCFRYLIEIGCDIYGKGEFQRNCLHFASIGGNIEILDYLLTHFSFNINEKDILELNSFHLAAENGNIDVMKYLINMGIDYQCDTKYQTNALFIATRSDHFEVIKYLLSLGFDQNRENKYGSKIIHIAATEENYSLVKYFIKKGIDINSCNLYGQTALSLSITNFNMTNYLIQKGSDIDRKYPYNRSILHIAKLKKSKFHKNDHICNLIILRSLETFYYLKQYQISNDDQNNINDNDNDNNNNDNNLISDIDFESEFDIRDQWKKDFIVGAITHQTPITLLKDEFGLLYSDYSSQFFLNVMGQHFNNNDNNIQNNHNNN